MKPGSTPLLHSACGSLIKLHPLLLPRSMRFAIPRAVPARQGMFVAALMRVAAGGRERPGAIVETKNDQCLLRRTLSSTSELTPRQICCRVPKVIPAYAYDDSDRMKQGGSTWSAKKWRRGLELICREPTTVDRLSTSPFLSGLVRRTLLPLHLFVVSFLPFSLPRTTASNISPCSIAASHLSLFARYIHCPSRQHILSHHE